MAETPLPFFQRFVLAYVAFFGVLFDGLFAARVQSVRHGMHELPPPKEPEPEKEPEKVEAASNAVPEPEEDRDLDPALLLLAALQRGGRLVDFLQQDVADFPDEEIGAAARVVHEGCRKELFKHVTIEAVRKEEEGDSVKLPDDFDRNSVKLIGNVGGKGPYKGVLRHKGWRVTKLELARTVGEHDPSVVAPAEVEI